MSIPRDPRPEDVRFICAWCKKHLKGDKKAPFVSHGICPVCFKKQTGQEPPCSNPRCNNPKHRHRNPLTDAEVRDMVGNVYDVVSRIPMPKAQRKKLVGDIYDKVTKAIHGPRAGDDESMGVGINPPRRRNPVGPALVEGLAAGAGFGVASYGLKKLGAVVQKKQRRARNPFAMSSNPPGFQQFDGIAKIATSVYGGLKAAQGMGWANPGMTLADAAESWARGRGAKIPARSSAAWKGLFTSWQRAGMPVANRTANYPKKKHKPGCACAACSAHRKKVGRRSAGAPGVSSHVKALDKFIAKNMSSKSRAVQKELAAALKRGAYSRGRAVKAWRALIDAACAKSKIPLSAAYRTQMSSQISEAFERKLRHGNPAVAIVGAGLNPGGRRSNPTDNKKRGDRGFVGTISLGEARRRAVAAGMGKQFDENVRAHKKFHGKPPESVRVYQSRDGQRGTTVEVGSISGRVPEITYISGNVVKGSNKKNRFYVHKTPAHGQPVEVWMAHKHSALRMGGTMRRTDWYRD